MSERYNPSTLLGTGGGCNGGSYRRWSLPPTPPRHQQPLVVVVGLFILRMGHRRRALGVRRGRQG